LDTPRPSPRTDWTRRVPQPVLIGRGVSKVPLRPLHTSAGAASRRQRSGRRQRGRQGSGGRAWCAARRRLSRSRRRASSSPVAAAACSSARSCCGVGGMYGVRDAACPLSTRGGTRLVRLVRGWGGDEEEGAVGASPTTGEVVRAPHSATRSGGGGGSQRRGAQRSARAGAAGGGAGAGGAGARGDLMHACEDATEVEVRGLVRGEGRHAST